MEEPNKPQQYHLEEELVAKVQHILQTDINEIQQKTGFNANLANARYSKKISRNIIAELKQRGVLKL